MFEVQEDTNIREKDGWMPIRNGKLYLKQNQLFFIHQLSQEIRRTEQVRLGFDSLEELYELILHASQSDSYSVKEKLHKVIDSLSPDLKNVFMASQ